MRINRAAQSLSGPQFVVKEVEEVRSTAQGRSMAVSARNGGFTRGRQLARAASDEAGNGAPTDAETQNVYRLSDLPQDVSPAVAVAQSLGRLAGRRGVQSGAMQVVEIASAIAGATMTRVLDNKGDVSWELDQLPKDAVHPGGATSSPGGSVWKDQRINVPGLRVENGLGQDTFADFEVNFKYNGSSLGFIEVSATKTEDAWGWGLTVKENITSDPNTYDSVPPSGQKFAAVKLRFHYRFDHAPLSDVIGIIDLTLYGNGTFAASTRWTQP